MAGVLQSLGIAALRAVRHTLRSDVICPGGPKEDIHRLRVTAAALDGGISNHGGAPDQVDRAPTRLYSHAKRKPQIAPSTAAYAVPTSTSTNVRDALKPG